MTTLSLFLLPTEELLAFEAKRKEAEENTRPPPEPVRARIPFTACLQAFTEPENVPDFWSSALQAKSAGVKSVLAGSTMTTAHSRSFIYLFILSVCVFCLALQNLPFCLLPRVSGRADQEIHVRSRLGAKKVRFVSVRLTADKQQLCCSPIISNNERTCTGSTSLSVVNKPSRGQYKSMLVNPYQGKTLVSTRQHHKS